jgi:hypothetical protein
VTSCVVAAKISLAEFCKSEYIAFCSCPPEGRIRIVSCVGQECGGREAIVRGFLFARTSGALRTAKSCGPGLPVLRPSATRLRVVAIRGQSSRSPGRVRISRKAIAQGRPDVRLVPVVLPRAFLLHADHGCDRRPAFPAPSIVFGANQQAKLGAKAGARMRTCVSPRVIPGRPQGEPGIHFAMRSAVRWIPGSRVPRALE